MKAQALAKVKELAKAPPVQLAIGATLVLLAVYYILRKVLGDVAGAVGGVLTGDNALTKGTPYEGAGVVATPAAAANVLLGGVPQKVGESNTLQDTLTRLFNEGYDGYRYSITEHRWTQLVRRSDGKIFNLDKFGYLTEASQ